MKYLLDTNVLSELRKSKAYPAVVEWVQRHPKNALFVSAVTIFEIDLGIQRVARRDEPQANRLRSWLENSVLSEFEGRVLSLDVETARIAASLQVPDPRPERDCFIAATALRHGMTVATRNEADFKHLDVPYFNPWIA